MQEVMKMMYILVESDDTSGISSPLKTTNRIKFLSLAVSENYIVFGASSGGLYVYDRITFTFKALVPSKEGSVTCVKISPDEKWFGFATVRGVCCVLEHSGSSVNRRILSHVHEGRKVTALQWNHSSSQLYVGDDSGQISVISVSSYLTPAVALMQLDSAIVQLDTCNYMLLASTMTRSFLCDTFREQYRQIGTRLRDGEFGGCFYQVDSPETLTDSCQSIDPDHKDSHRPFSSLNDGEWLLTDNGLQNIKLFCARPGLRLWEVRIDGAVMSTHQFKQLQRTSPVNVIRPPALGVSSKLDESSPQNNTLQFTKLCKLSDKYLLTYNANGICVLDPMKSEVVLWTDEFQNVIDVHVVGGVMYLWMGGSRLHAVCLTAIDKFLVRLYLQKQYSYCAQLCAAHVDILKKLTPNSSRLHVLVDLLQKIKHEAREDSLGEDILKKTKELLDEVSKTQSQDQAQMLRSGIFIVGNAHLLLQTEEMRIQKPFSRVLEKLEASSEDIVSNIAKKQDSFLQEDGNSEGDTMNGLFKKSILPSISSLSLLSEHGNGNSDEDYDPFPDLPLSSLTSTETIMALKNLTTTVSGTITNGTKSLREKWQNWEEKLRGQDEGGLSVEKSINRLDCGSRNSFENSSEEERDMIVGKVKKPSKLVTAPFINKCHQIENHHSGDEESLEELQFEMLDCYILLYNEFMQSLKGEDAQKNVSFSSEPKWTNCNDIIPFPFHQYFEDQFISTLSHNQQVNLSSGLLVKWVSKFLVHTDLDYRLFPSHIGRIHCKESLLLDQALGRFLKMSSGLLNPYSALKNLEDSGLPCQYFSWNVIIDHFHKGFSFGPASALDGESSDLWPLPRTLNTMLVLLGLGQVESCRSIGKHVPVNYVLRAMLRLEDKQSHLCKLFLSYLDKIPPTELLSELEDPEVYYFSRHAFESIHKAKPDEHCNCGYPLKENKSGSQFNRVGSTLLSHIYLTDGLTEAMLLCQKCGILWHHLLVLRRNEAVEEVLPLILQVASEEELKNRCSVISPTCWDLIFQLRSKLEQGCCLHCNARLNCPINLISWTSLASLLLHETTVNLTLNLLSKYSQSIPAGGIGIQFYQNCLLASLAEEKDQSDSMKRTLLDSLDDSKSLPVMSPELAGTLGLPHNQSQYHWGLELQLSKVHCYCCLLPLTSASGGSIISFRCRHSFHFMCLQQRFLNQCPICVQS